MSAIKIGIQLFAQCEDWAVLAAAAVAVDELGYDYLFLPDHLSPLHGGEDATMFEGISGVAALAAITRQVNVGLLVGSNTFRNPALMAKSIATIDHISQGRAVLGLGGGWHAREHEAWGVDFGRSPGQRLDWLDEALSLIRPLLDGETVTHVGDRYATDRLILNPRPVRSRLPIMVGGTGERKTLRTVARYADLWNAQVSVADAPHKLDVLRRHADEVDRDLSTLELGVDCAPIVRATEDEAWEAARMINTANGTELPSRDSDFAWIGSVEQVAARLRSYVALGFTTVTCSMAPPYDRETLTRLVTEVVPLAASAG